MNEEYRLESSQTPLQQMKILGRALSSTGDLSSACLIQTLAEFSSVTSGALSRTTELWLKDQVFEAFMRAEGTNPTIMGQLHSQWGTFREPNRLRNLVDTVVGRAYNGALAADGSLDRSIADNEPLIVAVLQDHGAPRMAAIPERSFAIEVSQTDDHLYFVLTQREFDAVVLLKEFTDLSDMERHLADMKRSEPFLPDTSTPQSRLQLTLARNHRRGTDLPCSSAAIASGAEPLGPLDRHFSRLNVEGGPGSAFSVRVSGVFHQETHYFKDARKTLNYVRSVKDSNPRIIDRTTAAVKQLLTAATRQERATPSGHLVRLRGEHDTLLETEQLV